MAEQDITIAIAPNAPGASSRVSIMFGQSQPPAPQCSPAQPSPAAHGFGSECVAFEQASYSCFGAVETASYFHPWFLNQNVLQIFWYAT